MAFDNQNKMHLKHTVFTVGAIEAWHTVTSVLVDQVVACSIVLTRLHLTVVYIWQITNRQCHSKRSSQEFHSTSRKMFIPFCQLNGNRLRFLVKSVCMIISDHDYGMSSPSHPSSHVTQLHPSSSVKTWNSNRYVLTDCTVGSVEACSTVTMVTVDKVGAGSIVLTWLEQLTFVDIWGENCSVWENKRKHENKVDSTLWHKTRTLSTSFKTNHENRPHKTSKKHVLICAFYEINISGYPPFSQLFPLKPAVQLHR